MSSFEIVEDVRRRYAETVKPRIQSRNYLGAYTEMDRIVSVLRRSQDDIIADVHFGLAFIAAAQVLYRELERGEPRPQTVEDFEACSAQTKLPKQRNENSSLE